MGPPLDLPKEIDKVADELDSLNNLVTVLVVVFILFVIIQILQTVLKVVKPKQKKEDRHCKPNAVIVQGKSIIRTSKRESVSHKSSSSRHKSLPSKKMNTILSLSTESECEKSMKSSKDELGSREECKTTNVIQSIPSREMNEEIPINIKMLNCSDVVNTPLPSTAPLALPLTSSKSSKESIDNSTKEKKEKSINKIAPTQPLSSIQIAPSTDKTPPSPSQATPTQATPTQATPSQVPPTQITSKKSPTIDTTQRGSVVEILTPNKNSFVTTKEEVKTMPISVPTIVPSQ